MSEDSMTRYRPGRDPKPADRTDWDRLRAMTEDEVEAAALSDPDNPPLTPEQRASARRIPLAQHVRWTLGLSQTDFAARFGIPLRTLQEWEQGRREPDAVMRALSASDAA